MTCFQNHHTIYDEKTMNLKRIPSLNVHITKRLKLFSLGAKVLKTCLNMMSRHIGEEG